MIIYTGKQYSKCLQSTVSNIILALVDEIVDIVEKIGYDLIRLAYRVHIERNGTYSEDIEDEETYVFISAVNSKLNMPDKGQYCNISWSSDNQSVIALDGTVNLTNEHVLSGNRSECM